jgi:hypothetical protein
MLSALFDTNGKIKNIFLGNVLDRIYAPLTGSRLIKYNASTNQFEDSMVRENANGI